MSIAAPTQWSMYQRDIFSWVQSARGDAIVNAVAGSGKTTTIIEAAKLIQGAGLFVAFNKHIAEELTRRLPAHMPAKTVHSIGYSTLRQVIRARITVEDRKYRRLAQDWADEQDPGARFDPEAKANRLDLINAICDLVDKARVTLTEPADRQALADMAHKYGIVCPPEALDAVPVVLRDGERMARSIGVIDFTDMIYLPYRWRLTPTQVAWVFVDECQDLSAAQLDLVLKLRAPGGRMLFVGDERQAIMGFAGADADSYWRIKAITNAWSLPLSICYRCPTSHLDLARAIVPQIEARPDAPAGELAHIEESALPAAVREGDLILCRLTAPLIGMCLRLIAQRVPARVRGRDIAKQLANTVREITERSSYSFDRFDAALAEYRGKQEARLMRRDASEATIGALHDRLDGILAVWDAYDAHNADELCSAIESLFADDRASVWLSTIHRAKGLEADRVYIMRPNKLPLVRPRMQPWEMTQELNLRYVALTRARQSLTLVHEPGQLPPAPEAAQPAIPALATLAR